MKTSVITLIALFAIYCSAHAFGGFQPPVKKQNFFAAMEKVDKKSPIFHFSKSTGQKPKTITARITYYNAHEDRFGSRVACSTKLRAQQGVTVAAHPDFPFWQRITIPGLKSAVGSDQFIIQDRGGDVTRKKASHGKTYVFDVFLNCSRRNLAKFSHTMPEYMTVILN